jgi:replicative DNA helicase
MNQHADNWDEEPEPAETIRLHEPAPVHHEEYIPRDEVLRPLPHAVGPEKSLLSSMLQDPQEFMGLAMEEGMTQDHFYLPAHSQLFGFMADLFTAGHPIELVSLVQKLLDKGMLERVGGPAAVTDLYTYAPSSGNFRHHLAHVRDKWILRSMIQHSNETIAQAYDQPDEVAELLDQREAAFLAIRNQKDTPRETTLRTIVDDALDDIQRQFSGDQQLDGISTGFEGLDKLGCRLKPGEMFVIAARPSMGKTSLMMNIVERLCIDQGRRGLVFSVEMTSKQIVKNLINSRARFNIGQLARGYKPNKADLQRMQRSALDIAQAQLLIDDRSDLSVGQFRAIARRKHKDKPLEWIAIDYLQLMKSGSKQAKDSREREVAEISAGIKGLAKELGIPIVVLAQLNRGPEGRTGKNLGKPRMSDLRESGALEQDADMVGLLYREAYYAQDDEAKAASAGRAQLDLAKNRNGATGACPLTFIAELMRFEDGAPEPEPDMFSQPAPRKSRFDD